MMFPSDEIFHYASHNVNSSINYVAFIAIHFFTTIAKDSQFLSCVTGMLRLISSLCRIIISTRKCPIKIQLREYKLPFFHACKQRQMMVFTSISMHIYGLVRFSFSFYFTFNTTCFYSFLNVLPSHLPYIYSKYAE